MTLWDLLQASRRYIKMEDGGLCCNATGKATNFRVADGGGGGTSTSVIIWMII